jgi:hypothetical protein
LYYYDVGKSFEKGFIMDEKNELIQRPTLSFPAYSQPKRPLWLLFLGGLVMILGIAVMILAVTNYWA